MGSCPLEKNRDSSSTQISVSVVAAAKRLHVARFGNVRMRAAIGVTKT